MDDKFDELARNMAQSVTRRGALKKFGVGLGAVLLASFGLPNKAEAQKRWRCRCNKPPYYGCDEPGAPLYCNCAPACFGF